MIALTNTQRQLELDLASASTTTLKVVATFSDIRYSDQSKNAGTTLSTSNGTTDVIIVAAPGNGMLRLVESISVTNPSGNDTETVRIYYDENGTEYDIVKVDLSAGDQLYYEDNQGWSIINSTGGEKTALSVDHGALTGLTDDDHTQYALLLGRASSQIIRGGTGASETLTLRGTSNATTGLVALNDLGGNVTVGGGATASELRVLEASGSGTNYTSFTCPAITANVNYTLPVDDGTASQFLQSNGSGVLTWATPASAGFTLGTEQASTSGTSITFTGIPAGTKLIIINMVGVAGTASTIQFQLGDAGGIEATGYLGAGHQIANTFTPSGANFTTGWSMQSGATNTIHGQVILSLEDSSDFTWTCSGILNMSNQAAVDILGGRKLLSEELTQVRITMDGIATFSAGAINISYI